MAFGVGTLAALFEVANATLFVSLVPPQRYVAANSLINGSRAMSFVVGPSAAGWLVQLLTAPVALIADALSYVGSAIQLLRIRPTEPPAETERKGQLGAGRPVPGRLARPVDAHRRRHDAELLQLHVRRPW